MKKAVITQIKSHIGRPEQQRLTLQNLGLNKINRSIEVNLTPQMEGMIAKVKHLISVKEI